VPGRSDSPRQASPNELPSLGKTTPSLSRHQRLFALALVCVGLLLTCIVFVAMRGRARHLRRIEFERQASQLAGAFRNRLELPLEVLHSIAALFDASDNVTRREFRAFVRDALDRHPGIRALEWLPIVPGAERAAVVNQARAEGVRDFEFKQVGEHLDLVRADERPEYLPILYMEPPDERALGFDVASDAMRRAPADRARDRQGPVVSERIRLVEDPPSIYSIAVFLPVYNNVALPRRVTGFATAVFRVHTVAEPVIKEVFAHGIQMALIDPAAGADKELLFESSPAVLAALSAHRHNRYEFSFPYVDRHWKLVFSSAADDTFGAGAPWIVLVSGLAVSVLLGLGYAALNIIYGLRRQVHDALQLGQYTLLEKLGEGGMGVVYRGRHALLRRPTAIKLLPPQRRNAHQIARFEREVQMTSCLTHPNTIAIYDYGHTPEGVFYYAMEYLDGITLQDLVDTEGPLPAGRVVRILEQVAGALAEAHELGLIHRDIKPANIMLTRRGGIPDFVKVLDFGLVKETSSEGAADISRAMPLLGTPLYLAPEGISSGQVDARADLYALGAVAYFLVTGTSVFEASSLVEVCAHHLYTEPVPPSQRSARPIAPALEALILHCLQKKPEARPQSATELLQRLREIARDIEPFSEAQALAFWEERGPSIATTIASRQRVALESSLPNTTIVVDPREREEPDDEPRSIRFRKRDV
jgi:serine/threonine protein kinase/CHASE1-domain containing sensor protein